ncbi:MAG: hypothetical protein FJ279_04350 [Planctomycetes bacterium]|nr:hypothetical protein [Planctomycetota bacterium]MBM4078452.1 hypothetical protein [Planctomycetota bacterium]MBM4087236.1 hypothetical protein [Planctomycetota bacterium]
MLYFKVVPQRAMSVDEARRLNQQAFERIWQEAKAGSPKWTKGQWIGLLAGQVVAASLKFDEVLGAIRQAEPDPRRGMMFRVGEDYDQPVRVL